MHESAAILLWPMSCISCPLFSLHFLVNVELLVQQMDKWWPFRFISLQIQSGGSPFQDKVTFEKTGISSISCSVSKAKLKVCHWQLWTSCDLTEGAVNAWSSSKVLVQNPNICIGICVFSASVNVAMWSGWRESGHVCCFV